ncbi:MAG: response regulator [Firmicutes bacterium]|jgi:PAS domain S-box-containing protein|nr:response regulator [Bacillota bacterium]
MNEEDRCLKDEDKYCVKCEVRGFLKGGIIDSSKTIENKIEKYINLMINLHDEAVLIHDDGVIRYANEEALKLFGAADPQELIGLDIESLFIFDNESSVKEPMPFYMEGEEEILKVWVEKEKEGLIEGEMISCPFPGPDIYSRNLVQTVIGNVSRKKKIRTELEKASRLNLLSTIAGGVAHDFNNFLAIMFGNISLCRKKFAGNAEANSILNNIENSIMRAKELSNQLLFYAKDGTPSDEIVPMDRLLKDIVSFALRGTSVCGEVDIPEGIGPVRIKPDQIAEAMNNLIINAVQAMPYGGKIYIQGKNLPSGQADGTVPSHLAGKELVKISVIDEGVGIPEEIQEKIFDRFVTTKPGGTGLGLPTSYRIIKSNGGDMDFHSKPGGGTIFNIYLPICKDETRLYQEEKEESVLLKGQGRVLVMDDLEPVRRMTEEMLRMLGYDVDCASDGSEAVTLYERSMQQDLPYDVVLVDMSVPGGINGLATVKLLHGIDPGVKAVMVSGYDCGKYKSQFFGRGFKGFLQKPFKIGELAMILDEVLTTCSEEKK